MTANQRFGVAAGAVYVLAGLAGFAVTAGVGVAAPAGGLLLGVFEVNPLHNLVHLLVGAALTGGAVAGEAPSRTVNMAVGAGYLLVGVLGFFVVEQEALNVLALNTADNFLHLATGALAVGVAVYGT
jgi:hypothetical protein